MINQFSCGGLSGRAPKMEEKSILNFMVSLDTEEQITEVPFHAKMNGVLYEVIWSDNPPENSPDDFLHDFYQDGLCAHCGKRSGDHRDPWFSNTSTNTCKFVEKHGP